MSYLVRRRLLWTLFLLGLALLAIAANATTLARMTFEDLARQATTIVRVRCLGSTSVWRNGEVWTESEFEVTETNKGTAPGILRITLPGGRIAHLQSHVDGVPIFHVGDDAYLFLWEAPGRSSSLLGWTQGAFRVRRDPQTGLELVTQDSALLPLFDPTTRKFRHGGVRNLALPAFQWKLKRALEKQNQ